MAGRVYPQALRPRAVTLRDEPSRLSPHSEGGRLSPLAGRSSPSGERRLDLKMAIKMLDAVGDGESSSGGGEGSRSPAEARGRALATLCGEP